MGKRPSLPLALLLAGCAVLHCGGCSVIGFLSGWANDSSGPDEYVYSPAGVDSIKHGKDVYVLTTNGETVFGAYAGRDSMPEEIYAGMYDRFTANSPLREHLPSLGEDVRIVTHGALGRGEQRGQFTGFAEDLVFIKSAKYAGSVGVLLEFVDTLVHNRSSSISGDTLRQLVIRREIPLKSTGLLIVGIQDTTSIPLDMVLTVRSSRSRYSSYKWWGLGIGAFIDGLMIWGISTAPILGGGP